MKKLMLALVLLSNSVAWSMDQKITVSGNGWLDESRDIPVLHLSGSEKEMGYQHGFLVGDKIQDTIDKLIEMGIKQVPAVRLVPISLFRGLRRAVGWVFWLTFDKDTRDHIKSMETGARARTPSVRLNRYDVAFLNSLIDIAGIGRAGAGSLDALKPKDNSSFLLKILGLKDLSVNCDSFAAWGARTVGGKTFQTRNTDVPTTIGIQQHPMIVIFKKTGMIPIATGTYAGIVGVFTGMNAEGVGLGQIWAFSKDVKLHMPWQLQWRKVLMSASSASMAVEQYKGMRKATYGSNFVLADKGAGENGSQSEGFAIEVDAKRLAVFKSNDPKEQDAKFNGEVYALPLENAVLRGDVYLDPALRVRQNAANGPSGDPRAAGSYNDRYLGQWSRIKAYEQKGILIGQREAEAISRETAMRGLSLQTAVYANTDREMWVGYSRILPDGTTTQAYESEYFHVPFRDYLVNLEVDSDGALTLSSRVENDGRVIDVNVIEKGLLKENFSLRLNGLEPQTDPSLRDKLNRGSVIEIREHESGKLIERKTI